MLDMLFYVENISLPIPEIKKFTIFPQQFTPDLCGTVEMIDGRRIYTTDKGDKYPSITTILSNTMELDKKNILENWKERIGEDEANQIKENAADRGTILHDLIQKYIMGEEYLEGLSKTTNLNKRLFEQFKKEIDKHLTDVRMIEKSLYCDSLKVCGRVDIIGCWDGKLSIIDLKTSTRSKSISEVGDYFLQETAYAICYAEHFGEKIEGITTLIATENSLKAKVINDTPQKHLTNLIKRVRLYHEENNNEKENI